jgi:hypothetical protein
VSTEFETENQLEYNFIPLKSGKLNFKVRAPNDAHVALTAGPAEGNPMYEVSFIIRYLRTRNGHFILSPDSYAVFITSIDVYTCIYFDTY